MSDEFGGDRPLHEQLPSSQEEDSVETVALRKRLHDVVAALPAEAAAEALSELTGIITLGSAEVMTEEEAKKKLEEVDQVARLSHAEQVDGFVRMLEELVVAAGEKFDKDECLKELIEVFEDGM